MPSPFTAEMRLKMLEAKIGGLAQDLVKLANAFDARTNDLRRAHNALVETLQKGPRTLDATPAEAKVEPTAEAGTA